MTSTLKTKLLQADGCGTYSLYEIEGHPEVLLEYDRQMNPTFSWGFIRIRNGFQISGSYIPFRSKASALKALRLGEPIF